MLASFVGAWDFHALKVCESARSFGDMHRSLRQVRPRWTHIEERPHGVEVVAVKPFRMGKRGRAWSGAGLNVWCAVAIHNNYLGANGFCLTLLAFLGPDQQ
jgi:hypothetical protein